jgi:EAL domain-containing protein (putative c-di-GMP-specific phosphodiesterase class I)
MDANKVYRSAEAAMYEAKRIGRGRRVEFEPAMHEEALHTFTIENDLRRALSQHELHLYYQPIASLADARILGFEALIRWWRAGGDMLLPDEFLRVAEDTGLIIPIGVEVLRLGCDQLRRWRAQSGTPDDVFLSINLSARQLAHPKLPEDVRKALEIAEIDPSDLMLEISECVLTNRGSSVPRVVAQLHELGVQLCLDSFGTGGLSLALLHRFPLSAVKIDRSFLADIGDDSFRWRMVDGLNALAVHLGLRVIVEGVEDRDQLNRLVEMGCHLGQGKLLSAAVDGAGTDRLLHTHPVW